MHIHWCKYSWLAGAGNQDRFFARDTLPPTPWEIPLDSFRLYVVLDTRSLTCTWRMKEAGTLASLAATVVCIIFVLLHFSSRTPGAASSVVRSYSYPGHKRKRRILINLPGIEWLTHVQHAPILHVLPFAKQIHQRVLSVWQDDVSAPR